MTVGERLPKLDVAGSNPVGRSILLGGHGEEPWPPRYVGAPSGATSASVRTANVL